MLVCLLFSIGSYILWIYTTLTCLCLIISEWSTCITGTDVAVALSSANGLVGSLLGSHHGIGSNREGFLKTQWVGVRLLHPFLSH